MNILIAGDFCSEGRMTEILREKQYEIAFESVKEIITKADYSIVNLECPIVERSAAPIKKCGPNLHGSKEIVEAIKWIGFDCATIANNHILDYGEEGMRDTLMRLNKECIDVVGGGMDIIQASNVLYKKIGDSTIAIINCCEHEFSIATEITAGANPLNPIQQYYKIQEAKQYADNILVIVHGGHENYQLPSPRMKEIYRFFIEAGADAVINHHQHCYSGYEVYNGKPIFYGLGNFCFDEDGSRNSICNEGFMVQLKFEKSKQPSYELFPYIQCNDEPSVSIMDSVKSGIFESRLKYLNATIANDKALQLSFDEHCKKRTNGIMLALSPWRNKITRILFLKGILPICKKKEELRFLLDLIQCESHSECFLKVLKNQSE